MSHPQPPVEDDAAVGIVVDKTARFAQLRAPQVARTRLLRARLEMRFVRLATQIQRVVSSQDGLADAARDYWTWAEVRAVRELMQELVAWEDGTVFERCRFCGQRFTFLNRRHHCRLCGLVVCGDLERECSLEVPAATLAARLATDYPELAGVHTQFPVRLCTECRFALLSARGYLRETSEAAQPPIVRLHYQLSRVEREISALLPEMLELVAEISAHRTGLERGRARQKQLLALSAKYDQGVRRVRALHFETDADRRLQAQMLEKCRLFWEQSIRPLKTMAHVLRPPTEETAISKPLARELQQKLVVLQEQRFLLDEQLRTATRMRHFDALEPIEQSIREIDAEIDGITAQLGSNAPSR